MSDFKRYYELTRERPVDAAIRFACSRVAESLPRVAIDCGCGAGQNSDFLLGEGFQVHGFDPSPDSIEICRERFTGKDASFSQDSFHSFSYPQASLVIASYSLFFCPGAEFEDSWRKIMAAVVPGGVFCGTFLGPNDTWALAGETGKGAAVIVHTLEEIHGLLTGFDIEAVDIKDFDGATAAGTPKHWHSFFVTAVKR